MKEVNIIEKVKTLPQVPGVYIFLSEAKSASGGHDSKKEIIYVGKATNLRSRVGSYFRNIQNTKYQIPDTIFRPIEMMIAQVADLEVQETESVLEALILEANLIKKHQPKYNVLGKDDKSYAYFVITKEEFPKVLIVRKTELDKADSNLRNYTNLRTVTQSRTVLGRSMGRLEDGPLRSVKIFGPYTSKKQMEIALKIMRKIFPFHSSKNKTEKGCLDFQLGRCPGPYAGAISKADYAKNIRGIQMILEGKKKSLLQRMEKEMLVLAKKEEFEKATEVRNKIFALQHVQDIALINREDKIQDTRNKSQTNSKNQKPKTTNFRIEAYDISNISGQQAVGSMVVFENNEPNKKEYRKFKIKTVEGAADVAMMQEVLSRRLNNAWTQPDLILLDGGQGHLNMAQKLLSEMGFVIPLVSVAKGPSRKNLKLQMTNIKQITNPKIQNSINKIIEDKNLIKSIMDEAHRFAITYHRKVRKSEFI
ncbi:MAG: Excinuclease ABC, C subunit [Candidatus Moranbacteria bacterium GW2011_GWA2_39_41]|nr:MAG: Excinuclease ABC, C subunit [Candidatus Moranbacteria bacterium GW2011_GWA2_39_41]